MLLTNVVVGLVQLIISIIFAVLALYIGFAVLSKINKNMDEEKEIARGNVAVGIIVAAVFVSVAGASDFILVSTPWIAILIVSLVFILLMLAFVNIKIEGGVSKAIGGVAVLIALAIFVISAFFLFSHTITQAMATGSDLVGFWDADLATPLELAEEFRQLLEGRPSVQWVLGSPWRGLGRDIRRSAARHYPGRVFATAVSLVLGLPVYDSQCGAKVFRVDRLLREIVSVPFISRWIFGVEMLARILDAHRAGVCPSPLELVYELPLSAWHHDGRSHVRARDFVLAAADLWRIWWRPGRRGP